GVEIRSIGEEHRGRLILRPVFRAIQLAYVIVPGRETVHGVGRKGDELTTKESGRRLLHCPRRIRREAARFHVEDDRSMASSLDGVALCNGLTEHGHERL